jgi:undecaprenyl-diphosphatase
MPSPIVGGLLIVAGAALLLPTATLAVRGVSAREEALFRVANRAPDAWFPFVVVPMQFGTYATTPAVAAVLWFTGRRADAVLLAAVGTAAWIGAKVVKRIAERGRPQHSLDRDVVLRGPAEHGSGFPSGHAATSTVLAIVLGAALGGWWWAVVIPLTLLTWFGRMYVGVHLPLDIVGGAGIGTALAGLGVVVAARLG